MMPPLPQESSEEWRVVNRFGREAETGTEAECRYMVKLWNATPSAEAGTGRAPYRVQRRSWEDA